MGGRWQHRIERVADIAAAAMLGLAIGFSLPRLMAGMLLQPALSGVAAVAAIFAFVIAARLLGHLEPERARFALPEFELAPLELDEPDELLLTDLAELLLTDADRLETTRAAGNELVLDDILAELGPDARVVRLFDRAAMPTPGQLSARIEGHLRAGAPAAPAPDASEALYEALTELRRSLR